MKILGELRLLPLCLATTGALFGQVDAREISRQAVAADARNWRIARNYTFLQRVWNGGLVWKRGTMKSA
jgi:hypothetical protein